MCCYRRKIIGGVAVAIGTGGIIYNEMRDRNRDQPNRRAIDWPDKPKRGWVCTARVASSGQQAGSCPEEEYAFGTASGPTYRSARAEAERIARRKLGKQVKHTQVKCVDNKGNRRN